MLHFEHPVLKALSEMQYDFYPTGSRYLGTETESSDHDFYTPVKDYTVAQRLKLELEKLGFKSLESGGYCADEGLLGIYRWKSPDLQQLLQPVDVLIGTEENIMPRLRIFERMKRLRMFALQKRLKEDSRAWSELFLLCQEINPPRS